MDEKYLNFEADWKKYWAKTFLFDALIGNTDRHQDNWGIILTPSPNSNVSYEKIGISPVFDNGTSMGSEISSGKFGYYEKDDHLRKYVSKGWHHMKWSLNDTSSAGHVEMLKKFTARYPEMRQLTIDSLKKVNGIRSKTSLKLL